MGDAKQRVTVSAANPSIVPAPAAVVLGTGANLTATATLAGGYAPTGTITFTLYGPNNTIVDTETAMVSGNGTYSTPTGYTPSTSGTYQWVVTYSGDGNNKAASTTKGSTPEVAVGPGATVVNSILYLVGGNTSDQLCINPVGSQPDGQHRD